MEQMTFPARARGLVIAQTTNLHEEERCAFVHAVALAQHSRSKLISLHVNDDEAARNRMPQALELLVAWGALPAGATEGDEQQLGMRHERILDNCCDDPVDSLVRALHAVEPDLVIASTAGRAGLARALVGSVSEALALHIKAPALLFPAGCRPFVSAASGRVQLRHIVVAAGDEAAASAGARHAAWLSALFDARGVEVELLHVEDGRPVPPLVLPSDARVRFVVRTVRGAIEPALLEHAEASHADLLVLATHGHDSVKDVLLGSRAERVLRRAACPVLSVPLS